MGGSGARPGPRALSCTDQRVVDRYAIRFPFRSLTVPVRQIAPRVSASKLARLLRSRRVSAAQARGGRLGGGAAWRAVARAIRAQGAERKATAVTFASARAPRRCWWPRAPRCRPAPSSGCRRPASSLARVMESDRRSLLLWQQGCDRETARGGVHRRRRRIRGGGISLRDLQEQAEAARPRWRASTSRRREKLADLEFTLATAAGNNLARWLTALPPNTLDAAGYRRLLQELARHLGFEYQVLRREPAASASARARFSRSRRAMRRAMPASRA